MRSADCNHNHNEIELIENNCKHAKTRISVLEEEIKSIETQLKEILETNNFYKIVAKDLDNKFTSNELSGAVTLSALNDTDIFEATVVANSPEDSKRIADSVAINAPQVISKLNKNATLEVIDDAILPTAPSSPNVIKNTVVAFAVGFILATLIVFIRKVFDNKIRYDEDLTTIHIIAKIMS